MTNDAANYRFSLRSLFLLTVAVSALMLEWKHWGTATLVGTVVTLASGATFLWFLRVTPARTHRRIAIACALLTFGNIVLLVAVDHWFWTSQTAASMASMEGISSLNGAYLVSVIAATLFIMGLARPLVNSNWNPLSMVFILLNLSFCISIGGALSRPIYEDPMQQGRDLARGYCVAIAVLAVWLVLRWVNSLPISREDSES